MYVVARCFRVKGKNGYHDMHKAGSVDTPPYVLITPARNEEAHIERLLRAVTVQSIPPLKYVVVSDGSTDGTDSIVQEYSRRFEFIELVRFEKGAGAGFGSKALAFKAGYARMGGIDYEFIGNLDADVSFEPDYFESILREFAADERLGLAGGWVHEIYKGRFLPQNMSDNSVAGPVQMFRRDCFEEIGGYIPLRHGGIDAAAEIMARMHGWRVHTIRSCKVMAHRPVLTGKGNILGQRFNKGVMNSLLGYHPLFQMAVFLRRVFDPPLFIGALCTLTGYFWTCARHLPKQVSPELVEFLRMEQMQRLGLAGKHEQREIRQGHSTSR